MTAVRSVKNQFSGINPYLHSYYQGVGGWGRFHNMHLSDLAKTLKAQLLPMGYTADLEASLQIRRVDEEETSYPRSDVTVYDLDPFRPMNPPTRITTSPAPGERVLSIHDVIPEDIFSEQPYTAVGIYEFVPGKADLGEPIVWIELLSPSNKPGGSNASEYLDKRLKILQSGIVLVEIDYLHEFALTLEGLVPYRVSRDFPVDGHPYRIAVIDPRPSMEKGSARVTEFDVDVPIPAITLPLNAGDKLHFDFGIPYRKTYEEALYGLELVDYRELPMNFHRYNPADQQRIANRIVTVLEAAHEGKNLEDAPFPVGELSLEEALMKIEALKI